MQEQTFVQSRGQLICNMSWWCMPCKRDSLAVGKVHDGNLQTRHGVKQLATGRLIQKVTYPCHGAKCLISSSGMQTVVPWQVKAHSLVAAGHHQAQRGGRRTDHDSA